MTGKELVAQVRAAFGWGEDVVVSAGPRGALGQIWRLDVGPARYALKEIFAEPPSEALIEAELAFAERAAAAGVRLPASHPDCEGHHLLAAPGGRWLRLFDWVDLRPVELAAHATPQALGALLAPPLRRPSQAAERPIPGTTTSPPRPTGRKRPRRARRGPRDSSTGWPPCPSYAQRSRRPILPG